MLPKNKTKKSWKSEVDSPNSPSILGLGDEWKQKHKQKKNDENQIKNPNPNRENREKRAIEKSFLFFFFFFFVFVRLDRRENKYKERNKLVPH